MRVPPRPLTSPDARERARALLGAAQRRQDLFAQALGNTESATQAAQTLSSAAHNPTGTGHPHSSLDHMVNHITESSDQELVVANQKLAHAREQAQRQMAGDQELAGFMAVAYGTPASAALGQQRRDVVDVQAREVPQSSQEPSDRQVPPGDPAR